MGISTTRFHTLVASEALKQIAQLPLGSKGKIRVAQMLRTIAPVLEDINLGREALLTQHQTVDETGKAIITVVGDQQHVALRDVTAFNEEWKELMAEVAEYPALSPLTEALLTGPKSDGELLVSAAQLVDLGPFFEFDDPQ